jgi:hypothetical protein
VSQDALYVFDAALLLGQRRHCAPQHLEIQLRQPQFLGQFLQYPRAVIVGPDEAVLLRPIALARIGKDERFARGIATLLLPQPQLAAMSRALNNASPARLSCDAASTSWTRERSGDKRTATFRLAALCAEATAVINLIAIMSGQRDP